MRNSPNVAAVLAVEDSQRVDHFALGQLRRQQGDGDEGSDVDVGNPDRDQKQGDGRNDRRCVLHADRDGVFEGFREIELLHFHN